MYGGVCMDIFDSRSGAVKCQGADRLFTFALSH